MLSNVAAPTLIKALLICAALLSVSAYLNVKQFVALSDAEEDCTAKVTTLQSEALITGKDAALAYSRGFAAAASIEDARIADRMAEIAASQEDALRRYRIQIAALQPLPADCGPGVGRVDAFNYWSNP